MLLYRNKSNQYDIIDLIDFLKSIDGLMDETMDLWIQLLFLPTSWIRARGKFVENIRQNFRHPRYPNQSF